MNEMRGFLRCALLFSLVFSPAALAQTHSRATHRSSRRFVATAYSQFGITRSGEMVRPGAVAADPRVLPLGSIIWVHDPKGYSGEYVVNDTGSKVKGRHIDIFMFDVHEAVRFGRHPVLVQVLRYGPGAPAVSARARTRVSEAGE